MPDAVRGPFRGPAIGQRDDLVEALVAAADIEHALLLQYLFAAFTMKKRAGEGGLSALQASSVNRWKGTVLKVAREEMAHLGTVCNLQIAIGAEPHLRPPPLPSTSPYFGAEGEFALTPFSPATLDRFIFFERPDASGPATVGGLYREIQRAIRALDSEGGLFVTRGHHENVDVWGISGTVRFGRITDAASAVEAIEAMIEQGEGAPEPGADSHYARFRGVAAELAETRAADPGFEPARPVTDAPERCDDPLAVAAGRAFTCVYETLIGTLVRYYALAVEPAPGVPELRRFSRALMTALLRPLGELLTELPAGAAAPGRTAAPSFTLPGELVVDAGWEHGIASRLSAEARALEVAAADPAAPPRLAVVAENLALAAQLAERTLARA